MSTSARHRMSTRSVTPHAGSIRATAKHLRCEHWTTATDHAAAVARTLTGEATVSDEIPYVWSEQYGKKLPVVGRIQPGDDVRFLQDEPERFVAVTGQAGEHHAALGLGAPAAVIQQRRALAAGSAWPV